MKAVEKNSHRSRTPWRVIISEKGIEKVLQNPRKYLLLHNNQYSKKYLRNLPKTLKKRYA